MSFLMSCEFCKKQGYIKRNRRNADYVIKKTCNGLIPPFVKYSRKKDGVVQVLNSSKTLSTYNPVFSPAPAPLPMSNRWIGWNPTFLYSRYMCTCTGYSICTPPTVV